MVDSVIGTRSGLLSDLFYGCAPAVRRWETEIVGSFVRSRVFSTFTTLLPLCTRSPVEWDP